MATQVWTVVSGPCKGMGSVDELKACVKGRLDVAPTSNEGKAAVEEAQRIHFALSRPGSARVGKKSQNPSLEDVIKANEMPDMKASYKKMDHLQDAVRLPSALHSLISKCVSRTAQCHAVSSCFVGVHTLLTNVWSTLLACSQSVPGLLVRWPSNSPMRVCAVCL